MEAALVADNLDGLVLVRLVVVRLDNVTKRPLSESFEDLKAVCNVVVLDAAVPPLVVIISQIGTLALGGVNLLHVGGRVVYLGVVADLVLLV